MFTDPGDYLVEGNCWQHVPRQHAVLVCSVVGGDDRLMNPSFHKRDWYPPHRRVGIPSGRSDCGSSICARVLRACRNLAGVRRGREKRRVAAWHERQRRKDGPRRHVSLFKLSGTSSEETARRRPLRLHRRPRCQSLSEQSLRRPSVPPRSGHAALSKSMDVGRRHLLGVWGAAMPAWLTMCPWQSQLNTRLVSCDALFQLGRPVRSAIRQSMTVRRS